MAFVWFYFSDRRRLHPAARRPRASGHHLSAAWNKRPRLDKSIGSNSLSHPRLYHGDYYFMAVCGQFIFDDGGIAGSGRYPLAVYY